MKTYIINLKDATDRYQYMRDILKKYKSLDLEFIEAVDGRLMSESERKARFNIDSFKARQGCYPKPGEIGCTLSHRECYRKLLDSAENAALILEDDIVVKQENFEDVLNKVSRLTDTDIPMVILLSDWFWYSDCNEFDKSYKLANVYHAFLAQSYVINKAAARIILNNEADYVADHWHLIKRMGVKVSALIPHLIDQKWDGTFETSIQSKKESKSGVSIRGLLRNPKFLIRLFYLKRTGRLYRGDSKRTI